MQCRKIRRERVITDFRIRAKGGKGKSTNSTNINPNLLFLEKILLFYIVQKIFSNLDYEVYYLHRTDDRKAGEEPHGSSYG